jgi:Uma2 family endonuclease
MATQRIQPDDLLDIELPSGVTGFELVDGELVPVTPPKPRHARLATAISHRIATHVETLGPPGRTYVEAGYVLGLARDRDRTRAPDVSFITESTLNAHGGEPETLFRFPPDLAIEVEASGTRKAPLQPRIVDFLEAGVRQVWTIHPSTHSVTVYRQDGTAQLFRGDSQLEGGDVLPGFTLSLAELFRE